MIRHHYESLDEFCTAPSVNPVNDEVIRRTWGDGKGTWERMITDSGGERWFGATTVQEAADRVRKGWPEGAARIYENLAALDVPAPVSVKRRLVRGAQGDELDIHSIYRGDLDHAWSSRRRKQTRSKLTVRIVAQTNMLSNVTADEMFWRGAAIVKLCDVLTEAGYGVEILGAVPCGKIYGVFQDFLCTYPIKHSSDPIDCDQVAGVVANAGFHRIYGFRMYAAVCAQKAEDAAGYIGVRSCTTGRVIENAKLGADGIQTFVAPYHITSKETAQAWLEKILLELNERSVQ